MPRTILISLALGWAICLGSFGPPASSAPFDETPRLPPPSREDLERYYPKRARDEGIQGSAVIECTAARDGRLSACRVVSETPPGSGFGEASIRAATKLRMRPSDRSRGRSVAGDGLPGTRVRIPMNWSLSDEPDAPPPQALPIPEGAS